MGRQGNSFPIVLVLIALFGGFVAILWVNSQPEQLDAVVPTQVQPTDSSGALDRLLREGFGENSTPLPTVAVPLQTYAPPTLVSNDVTSAPIGASDLGAGDQQVAIGATPTLPPPSNTPSTLVDDDVTPSNADVELLSVVTSPPSEWRPAPLVPPINKDPLQRDHYWFRRPIDSNANNAVLSWYAFGSDGPNKDDPYRIHHGVDMPNPVGQIVRAAGSGIVQWAADGRRTDLEVFQNSGTYGNVVLIEHDFAYENQPVYTLYAHMSLPLVKAGDYVQAGDIIGLVGDTGVVSGPHVHFEVRLGQNTYGSTYNPVLWMVPYEGHGVIAGSIVDERGNYLQDVDISARNLATTAVYTTTSYVMPNTGSDVNPDPKWRENFTIADVPVGRYNVSATINGERVVAQVTVVEGMTNFVELVPVKPSTPEPLTDSDSSGG